MVEEVLKEHIDQIIERGLSRKEVRSLLVNAGWPADVVQKYLSKAKPNEGVILRVQGISKAFGSNIIVQSVDFDVRAGEIFGIIGLSGAGKTTLLNLIVGFLKSDRGDVVFASERGDISIVRNPDFVKKYFGFSTQSPSFYPKLTVLENLGHFGTLAGLDGRNLHGRSRELLNLVCLSEARDVRAENLSGGMQKRLDIACALIHRPDILFLDEPTADLDPVSRKQLWALIKDINRKGTTIILASHFLTEIELLCSRIGVLQNKNIIEIGTADELRSVYSRNFEVHFESEGHDYKALLKKLNNAFLSGAEVVDDEVLIETEFPEKILPAIVQSVRRDSIVNLSVSRPSLGKVFEALVKK